MSLILRPPTLIDIGLCAHRLIEEDRQQWTELTGSEYDPNMVAAECWEYRGPRWVICTTTDSMPLAVAGIRRMRPYVGQSWFLSTDELWKHGRAVTDITRKVMLETIEFQAHRIETLCLASRTKARSWYEAVGLHFEAEFRKYGAMGADFVQYAVLRAPET